MAPICLWGVTRFPSAGRAGKVGHITTWSQALPPPPHSLGMGQGSDSFPHCPQKAKGGKKAHVSVSTVLSLVLSPTRQRVQQKLKCRKISTGMWK